MKSKAYNKEFRAAQEEFNEGAKHYNTKVFERAVVFFRTSSTRFKRLRCVEETLYSKEMLARSLEKLSEFFEATKEWVFCVAYSVKYNHRDKIELFVERFCRNKYQVTSTSDKRFLTIPVILKEMGVETPPWITCQEINHYLFYGMKLDEKKCIEELRLQSKKEVDMFYESSSYVLSGLLKERQVRLRVVGLDINKKLLMSFDTSHTQLCETFRDFHIGLSKLVSIDDFYASKLLEVSHIFYHHGKLMKQIKVLQWLLGSPDDRKKVLYKAYLIRTMVDLGYLKQAEKLEAENNLLLQKCDNDDNNGEMMNDQKVKKKRVKLVKLTDSQLLKTRRLQLLMGGYLRIERDDDLTHAQKGLHEIRGELEKDMRGNSSSEEADTENLLSFCNYLLARSYLKLCQFPLALEHAEMVKDKMRGVSGLVPDLIPRHGKLLLLGEIYEGMGNSIKALLCFNKGIQSSIFSRSRVACIEFLLRRGVLQKKQNEFQEAWRSFDILDELFDVYYNANAVAAGSLPSGAEKKEDVPDYFFHDDLDYLTVLHVLYYLERSDLLFKCLDYEGSCHCLNKARECIMRNNLFEVMDNSLGRKMFALTKRYEANEYQRQQPSSFMFDSSSSNKRQKLKNLVESVLEGSKNVSALEKHRMTFLLAKTYIPKKYVRPGQSSPGRFNEMEMIDKENMTQNTSPQIIVRKMIDSIEGDELIFSAPEIAKPVFSAAGHVLSENLSRSYFGNMSLGISLRHEKCGLLSRKVEDMHRNRKRGVKRIERKLKNFQFESRHNLDFMYLVSGMLPEGICAISMCLSHDFSAIQVSRMERGKAVVVEDVPLVIKYGDVEKVRNVTVSRILRKKYKLHPNDRFYHVGSHVGGEELNLLYAALREFDKIMKMSKDSIKSPQRKLDGSHKKKWWEKRHNVDNMLRELVHYIQTVLWSKRIFPGDGNFGGSNNKHVVLILDKLLQTLPFESISQLRSFSVSRMPSLHLLYSHLIDHKKDKLVDVSKTYYVVNPDGTLPKTQTKFQQMFQQLGWDGTMGENPTKVEFETAYRNNEALVYMGHGGGEEYIHSENILKAPSCTKMTMLMGCSSGRLLEKGDFEPVGSVLNYLLSGCHCVIANLWDVTDGDCDRFSHYLLNNWLRSGGKRSIVEIMPEARRQCVLKYINGAAAVCYGLPVYVKVK